MSNHLKSVVTETGKLNFKNLSAKLHHLMQLKNVNEAELARQTSLPQPTIHKILSGKTSDPRMSTLKTIANYFQLTLDDLYSGDVLFKTNISTAGKSIPIISWEDCTKQKHVTTSLSATNWEKWILIDHANGGTYGLITKPSMESRFPRKTVLIIDIDVKPIDGDLIVVQYPDTLEATLREISIDGPNKVLLSTNPTSAQDKLDINIKIIGTVIQSRFSYQD